MPAPSPLARVAGATPVRLAVNKGFHAYARRRTNALAWADPVEVQRRVLLKLVRAARSTRFGRRPRFRLDPLGRRLPGPRADPNL